MNENLDPEEVEAIMRRIKQEASRIIESFGGIVNQFVGDEVVALYGVSEAHEDDPLRAVTSALELHQLVVDLSPEVEIRTGQSLSMHTGINTGLIVTSYRDTRDGLYGITGETVIVAARLKTEAQPDEILVSNETQKLISPYIETEILPEIALKGRAKPLIPYRVISKTEINSRFAAWKKRGFSNYIGRQQELGMLQSSLERVIRGQGQFVTVTGEAGIGKSRLLYQFRHAQNLKSVTILQGKCQSYGDNIPYLPFLDVLREQLDLSESDDTETLLRKVTKNTAEIHPSLRQHLRFYLHLLSIQTDPMITHMQGAELRYAMQEALGKIITLTASLQPTILILEDWHWHDEASDEVLKYLIGIMKSYALMLVVTYRTDHLLRWDPLSCDTPIALLPLNVPDSHGIIEAALKADVVPPSLSDLIYERTAGNPLFIEEICHGLAEEGVVVIRDRTAKLTRPLTELALPDTVQSIIRSRLDRLDWELKEVLRLASVIGRVFALRVLEKLYDHPVNLRAALETLSEMDMVMQVKPFPDAEYMFKHVLTQQVTYDTLLLKRRKLLHGLVGQALEQVYRYRLQELVNLLFYHFSLAEDWQKIISYGRESAEKAKKLSQFEEGLQVIEQIKVAIARLPQEEAGKEILVDTLLEEERLCDTLGWRERQQAVIEQVFSSLRFRHSSGFMAAAYLRKGDLCTLLGQFEEADQALNKSLDIRKSLGDGVGESNTLRSLSFLRWHQGNLPEAIATNEAALALDRERGDIKAMSHDLTNLAPVLQYSGDTKGALERLQEALRLEELQQDPFNRMTILFNIANVHNKSGDLDQSLEYYEKSWEVCRKHRLRINETLVISCIASIYWKQGRQGDSIRLYREVVQICRSMKYGQGLSNALRALGDFLLLSNQPEEALFCFMESTKSFAELGDSENEALSWSILATIYEGTYKNYVDAYAALEKARNLYGQTANLPRELKATQEIGRLSRDRFNKSVKALQLFEMAFQLAVKIGDIHKQGELLNTMGITEWNRGAYVSALSYYDKALNSYSKAGDAANIGLMLTSMGVTLRCLGRHEEALARLKEALNTNRAAKLRLYEGYALASMGDVYLEKGEHNKAIFHYKKSLKLRREIGDRRGEAWMLYNLAMTYSSYGASNHAGNYMEEALAIAEECRETELINLCTGLQAGLQVKHGR